MDTSKFNFFRKNIPKDASWTNEIVKGKLQTIFFFICKRNTTVLVNPDTARCSKTQSGKMSDFIENKDVVKNCFK